MFDFFRHHFQPVPQSHTRRPNQASLDKSCHAVLRCQGELAQYPPGAYMRKTLIRLDLGRTHLQQRIGEPIQFTAIFDHCTIWTNVQQLRQRVYLPVGLGTIADISRFPSFSARRPFISLSTAPSVDAYAYAGATPTMGGLKLTVPDEAPVAIFADLQTVREAPREMVVAGFGACLENTRRWRTGDCAVCCSRPKLE
jgi:hypothetical protein